MSDLSTRDRYELWTAALILLGGGCGAVCVWLMPRLFDDEVGTGVVWACVSTGIACLLMLSLAVRERRQRAGTDA